MVALKILTVILFSCILAASPVCIAAASGATGEVVAAENAEQQNAFDNAFAGYKNARDLYSEAKQSVDNTRSRARQSLLDKGKAFMLHADKAAIRYLDVLRERIEQVEGIPDDRRQAMLDEIKADSEWLVAAQSDIENAQSIEELRDIAKQLREHWKNYRGASKRMAGLALHEKLAAMIARAEGASSRIASLITALKTEGKDTGALEESLKAFDRHVAAAKEKNNAAREHFENIPGAGDTNSSFKDGMKMIREAHRELKEAHGSLVDINKEIKAASDRHRQ